MKSFLDSFLEKAEAKGIAIGEERVRQSIFQSLLSEGMPRERAIKIVGLNESADRSKDFV